MAKRPALTEESFLGFVFQPSKHKQPVGLRKTVLTGTKGRNKRRLAAFNRMSAGKQAILDRTGKREAYLKGETTLVQAKAELRTQAVQLGVAKPVRARSRAPRVPTFGTTTLDRLVQQHIKRTVVAEGRPFSDRTSDRQVVYLQADDDMLGWTYEQVKYAGRPGSEYEVMVGTEAHNPFWYH